MDILSLLARYNQSAPRYTSYPPAPQWQPATGTTLLSALERSTGPLSIYVHIPFCERLCLYCGCNVVINKNHSVAAPYVDSVLGEFDLLQSAHGRLVTQIHWGGGTPTYLDSNQLKQLFYGLASRFAVTDNAEVSIELDPRVTTVEQLRTLRMLGFNRLSMGIQDFDPFVQAAVHRVQSVESTRILFEAARGLEFGGVNVDLIYGLPKQTVDSFARTLDQVIDLNPDRIAVFSYAHVPSLKRQQRAIEPHLPTEELKLALFLLAIERLTAAGYVHIGLDHFAKRDDALSVAHGDGSLHRNFQGYTTQAKLDLLAFGVSAISHIGNVFAQNTRETQPYQAAIAAGETAVVRGYTLTEDDHVRAAVIESLLCNGRVDKDVIEAQFGLVFEHYFRDELTRLIPLGSDGLVTGIGSRVITLTPPGRIFSRVVARTFDAFAKSPAAASKAI